MNIIKNLKYILISKQTPLREAMIDLDKNGDVDILDIIILLDFIL